MPSRALAGVDIGTSSAKGAVFDLSGRRLAAAEVPYRYSAPAPGWAEADAETWWRATRDILARLVEGVGPRAIEGVGITGQAPTLLAIDGEGAPLGPAMLWLDMRSAGEVAPMAARLDPDVEQTTGNRLHAYYLGPKIAWWRAHEPARHAATATILQSHSYPVMRLTGERVTDYSSAALCAPLYDARSREWSVTLCGRLGVDVRLLPRLAPAQAVAGYVTPGAARETGLAPGTPVVVGGADFAASTLAAGVTEPGEACLMLGTAGNLVMPFSVPVFDTRLINGHHVGCDRYLALGATLAGAVRQWFCETAAPGVAAETLEAEGAAVAAGADGVRMLPYLQGERTPVWDAGARGAFIGLSLAHGRGHLYRAVLESVAVSLRHCLEVAREQKLDIREVIAVNGGARSAVWRHILCDALGVPIGYLPETAGAPAGAALLAGIGVGALPGVAAAKHWRGAVRYHAPDPRAADVYAELLAQREALYRALRNLA